MSPPPRAARASGDQSVPEASVVGATMSQIAVPAKSAQFQAEEAEEAGSGYIAPSGSPTFSVDQNDHEPDHADQAVQAGLEVAKAEAKVPNTDQADKDEEDKASCGICYADIEDAIKAAIEKGVGGPDGQLAVWSCGQPNCSAEYCLSCAIKWANQRINHHQTPSCPNCTRPTDLDALHTQYDRAHEHDPFDPFDPFGPEPILPYAPLPAVLEHSPFELHQWVLWFMTAAREQQLHLAPGTVFAVPPVLHFNAWFAESVYGAVHPDDHITYATGIARYLAAACDVYTVERDLLVASLAEIRDRQRFTRQLHGPQLPALPLWGGWQYNPRYAQLLPVGGPAMPVPNRDRLLAAPQRNPPVIGGPAAPRR